MLGYAHGNKKNPGQAHPTQSEHRLVYPCHIAPEKQNAPPTGRAGPRKRYGAQRHHPTGRCATAQVRPLTNTERKPMKPSNILTAAFAGALLSFIACTGCGSTQAAGAQNTAPNNPSSPSTPSTGYTAASLTGTYAFNLMTALPNNGSVMNTALGTLTLDGNGNITSAAMSRAYQQGSAPCSASGTGTYSVQSSGSGTAMLTLASTGNTACSPTATFQFTIQAAQQGEIFLLQETDNQRYAIGNAAKI